MNNPVAKLEESLVTLFAREQEYETACTEAAEAEHAYKMKYAKEFRAASGTRDERLQTAEAACDDELLHRLKTDAIRAFTKEKLKDVQLAISARQSILNFEVRIHGGNGLTP